MRGKFLNSTSKSTVFIRGGEYAVAIAVARKALELAEQTYGPDYAEVGTTLNNLAALYRAQGLDDKARELQPRIDRIPVP